MSYVSTHPLIKHTHFTQLGWLHILSVELSLAASCQQFHCQKFHSRSSCSCSCSLDVVVICWACLSFGSLSVTVFIKILTVTLYGGHS